MEYIIEGKKYIIDGDTFISDNIKAKKIIGANYNNGVRYGGYLSSFNKSFSDELISIQTGIDGHINTVIGDISDAYNMLKDKIKLINLQDIYEISCVVFQVVDEYFNGINNLESRLNYYKDEDELKENEYNKISNLKNSGAAACVERAALSQNLLRFLGINSYYKSSGIKKDGRNETHSFNIIEFNNEYYIFDSSIPNLINNTINPLITKLSKEEFDLITYPMSNKGISISVSHYNPYRNKDVSITYDSGRKIQVYKESLSIQNEKRL